MSISPEDILLESLSQDSKRPAPIVDFVNDTPSGWEAVIVAMGAVFWYKDANDKPLGNEQQQRPGPLYSGQSSFVQGSRKDCTGKVFAAITVKVPDEEAMSFTQEIPDTPKECFIRTKFVLKPKSRVANSGERNFSAALELKVENT